MAPLGQRATALLPQILGEARTHQVVLAPRHQRRQLPCKAKEGRRRRAGLTRICAALEPGRIPRRCAGSATRASSPRLGSRKEPEAIDDPAERERKFDAMAASAYGMGRAVNMASFQEIDDGIDPADTRGWIMRGLKSAPALAARLRPYLVKLRAA